MSNEKKVWLLWKDNLGFTDQLTARTLYQKAQNPPMNIFLLGEKIARLKNTPESDFFFQVPTPFSTGQRMKDKWTSASAELPKG